MRIVCQRARHLSRTEEVREQILSFSLARATRTMLPVSFIHLSSIVMTRRQLLRALI